jgi:hypothetical protein
MFNRYPIESNIECSRLLSNAAIASGLENVNKYINLFSGYTNENIKLIKYIQIIIGAILSTYFLKLLCLTNFNLKHLVLVK